ncbi:MAG: MBL fold metallo-hydrolase RNA specificity domain-containing protein [Verrucomicrobiales bacterium]
MRPKTILLVHGDPEATAWFKAKLGEHARRADRRARTAGKDRDPG